MMTEEQRIEIAKYLLTKNMSVDVVMEIHDHFCTHITELMLKDDITFDEAFDHTRFWWKDDLKMIKLGNGQFVPKINKDIAAEQEKKVAFYAIVISAMVFTLLSSASNILSAKQYSIFITVFWSSTVLVPVMFFLVYIKDFLIAWQMKGFRLNTHQKSIMMLAPGYILMQNTIFSFQSHSRLHDLFYGPFTKIDLAILVVAPFGLLAYFFGLLSMFNFIGRMQRTKPFLHFLKP